MTTLRNEPQIAPQTNAVTSSHRTKVSRLMLRVVPRGSKRNQRTALNSDVAEAEPTAAPDADSGDDEVEGWEVPPGWATMPAALLELGAAAMVVNHAAGAPDMAAVIWASALALTLYFTWVFHNAAMLRRRFFQNFLLTVKLLFGTLLAAVLWDMGTPHKIWDGDGFVVTDPAGPLSAAAGMLVLAGVGLLVFRLLRVTSRGVRLIQRRWRR